MPKFAIKYANICENMVSLYQKMQKYANKYAEICFKYACLCSKYANI